jgi:type II secretory pathway component HofQ
MNFASILNRARLASTRRLGLLALTLALFVTGLGGGAPLASAAPASVPPRAMDLELREVDVRNLFRLLADVSGRPVVLDACVQGKVDLTMRNTPLPLVFDALASKLNLSYEDQGSALLVHCAAAAERDDARLASRVSVRVVDADLVSLLDLLAASAKLDGVDVRTTKRPKITMQLEGVRLSTALTAVADIAGLRVYVAGGKLVASE